MTHNPRPLALLTGASSGIGAELARLFARDRFDLILSARRQNALEALAADLRAKYFIEVTVLSADLSRAESVDALARSVLALNRPLDALVNNAGYGVFGEFKDTSLDAELSMMNLNMAAPVMLTKRLLPCLLARGGKVLNIASTAAFQPGPYMAVYYASKAFLLSWSEALAEELRATKVTVTAVCPGPAASGFQQRAAMQDSALVKDKRLPSAASVAKKSYQALNADRRVYIPGLINWLMAQSIRFTPRRLVTRLVRILLRPTAT